MSKPKEYPLGALQGEELKLMRPEHIKFYFVNEEVSQIDIVIMKRGSKALYGMRFKQIHEAPLIEWPDLFFFLNYWHAYAYFLKVTQESPNE